MIRSFEVILRKHVDVSCSGVDQRCHLPSDSSAAMDAHGAEGAVQVEARHLQGLAKERLVVGSERLRTADYAPKY